MYVRLSLFESNLRHFSACVKKVSKSVSKMSQKGIWGDLVDGRSVQGYLVFTFKLYDFTIIILWYKVQ